MKSVVVFGAGIAGLAAARELSKNGFNVAVYESDKVAGGQAATLNDSDGTIYDRGPHFLFTTLAKKVGIEEKCFRVPYYESIFYKQKYYGFPFGLMKNPGFFLSVGLSYAVNTIFPKKDYDNLGDLLRRNYGGNFTEKILGQLIQKWAGVPVDEISKDFGFRLLPGSVKFILYSILKKLRGYTEDYFEKGRYMVYPQGGMKTVIDKLADKTFRVELSRPIEKIIVEGDKVVEVIASGNRVSADYYISTIPVDNLLGITVNNKVLEDRLSGFRYRGIILLYLKAKSRKILETLWSWYPEKEYPFYRISEQIDPGSKDSNELKDKTVLVFEFGGFEKDSLWNLTDDEIKEIGIRHSETLFNLKKDSILDLKVERIRAAYPILLKSYEGRQRQISMDSGIKNLLLAGKTGLFKYFMLEEAYDSGIEAAKTIIERQS